MHTRLRRRVSGNMERPRLCVYRSLGHIYAQVIDDLGQRTLASASSLDKETRTQIKGAFSSNRRSEIGVGKVVAQLTLKGRSSSSISARRLSLSRLCHASGFIANYGPRGGIAVLTDYVQTNFTGNFGRAPANRSQPQ